MNGQYLTTSQSALAGEPPPVAAIRMSLPFLPSVSRSLAPSRLVVGEKVTEEGRRGKGRARGKGGQGYDRV